MRPLRRRRRARDSPLACRMRYYLRPFPLRCLGKRSELNSVTIEDIRLPLNMGPAWLEPATASFGYVHIGRKVAVKFC